MKCTITSLLRWFVLIIWLIGPLHAKHIHQSHDNMVIDMENPSMYHNCINGKSLISVLPNKFFPDSFSFQSNEKIELTTYQINESPITIKQYMRYVKLSGKVKIPEKLKGLNQHQSPHKPIVGVTWDEASSYCRFHGQSLPTEAEFENTFYFGKVMKPNPDSKLQEWTEDYYSDSPRYPSNLDPVYKRPSHYKVVRLQSINMRRMMAMTHRNDATTFRCVTHLKPFQKKEIALNYNQHIPDSSLRDSHYFRIDTIPQGAILYENPTYNHKLGITPYFGTTSEKELVITIKKDGYLPEIIHLKTPFNRGQKHSIKLKPIPDETFFHHQREIEMTLIPAGRIKIGLSQLDLVRIKNEIVRRWQNRDLSEEQVRRYLKPETPDRVVYVKDFYIDQTEVTNSQYNRYVTEAGEKPSRCSHLTGQNSPDHPVTCVTWAEALSYCKFYNLDLPTEVQFEKASKGADIHARGDWMHTTIRRVNNAHSDASRYSIMDLGGNVSEWLYDWYDEEAYRHFRMIDPKSVPLFKEEKVVRGPSFTPHRMDSRLSKRRSRNPNSYALDLGFRCVKNLRSTR